jgi:hypothetical protein
MREQQLNIGLTGFMIMFYERPYTSLGEKIVTAIGVLVVMVVLSVSIVGFHVVMRLV